MTVCKILAQGKNGLDDITVYEKYEKYDSRPYYEITVSRDGIAYLCEKTARTTWKKRFHEIID